MGNGHRAKRSHFCPLLLAVCMLGKSYNSPSIARMRNARTLNIELLNLEPFLEFLELALPPAVGYTLCQRKK